VAVNCAALPETLIEAELFGYQSGAFTGAKREGAPGRIREAEGGTLFLDEIGDMPLSLQARLLRVLQDREVTPLGAGKPIAVDFALVCATHRHLQREIQAGRFREDLYYRLNGLTLCLPALRERTDFEHLLDSHLQHLMPQRPLTLAADLRQRLRTYHWPGNVRQLASALRTACALLDAQESVIDWHHLPDDLAQALAPEHCTRAAVVRRESFGSRPHAGYWPQYALSETARNGLGPMSLAQAALGVARSQQAMNNAAITGPMTKPLMPNSVMPPSVEINTT
jgi:transcriptional regulator with PAS, ATPase and Fis domain